MTIYVGVDVSASRGCAVAAVDHAGRSLGAAWTSPTVDAVSTAVQRLAPSGQAVVIGIDAPRQPAEVPREWYWEGKASRWRRRSPGDKGWGRHCEVVISALGLAKPQWSCPRSAAPDWMVLGFDLFESLAALGVTLEVFPSACYAQLANAPALTLELHVSSLAEGPKDVLDAYVGALTTLEYSAGRGTAVGGGDGLGTIVLPRPVDWGAASAVREWPGENHSA